VQRFTQWNIQWVFFLATDMYSRELSNKILKEEGLIEVVKKYEWVYTVP